MLRDRVYLTTPTTEKKRTGLNDCKENNFRRELTKRAKNSKSNPEIEKHFREAKQLWQQPFAKQTRKIQTIVRTRLGFLFFEYVCRKNYTLFNFMWMISIKMHLEINHLMTLKCNVSKLEKFLEPDLTIDFYRSVMD